MSRRVSSDIGASVRRRLLNLAREAGEDFQLILTRFALERFLYRLGRSGHRESFLLKGAMLFRLWGGQPHRMTRDLDLHGSGDSSIPHLEAVFREICGVSSDEDGLKFLPETIQGEAIRESQEYDGIRLTALAVLAGARIPLQIDIGFGDVVVPDPLEADYPTVLDLPAPRIRVYPRETVVAEKFHALVLLGIANSRMKDYYDLWILTRTFHFDGETLARAIHATFERRRTEVPDAVPLGLSGEFADDRAKQTQWRAFVRKNRLEDARDLSLVDVVAFLRGFLMPPAMVHARGEVFGLQWSPPGPWSASTKPGR